MAGRYSRRGLPVKDLAVDWVLVDLPVARVDDVAVIAAQYEPAAVRDGVGHPDGLAPCQQHHRLSQSCRISLVMGLSHSCQT
eukprot:scaffold164133_cov29-Prasinocladus_malaysianus.AAC.1